MIKNAFLKINAGILAVERVTLVILHTLIAVLIVVGVLFRYLLNDPLVWIEEFLVGLFVWLAFIGASYAASTSDHLQVNVLRPLYEKYKFLFLIPVSITMVIVGILFFSSLDYVQGEITTTSPSLNISRAWFAAAVPVGMLGILIHVTALFVEGGAERILFDATKMQLTDDPESFK